MRRDRERYPEKTKARNLLNRAVLAGRVERPSACEECGSSGEIHAHHADYAKPLAVDWLCRLCHEARHHSVR
jgi:hypothetical protein